jgi:hypothetical protein
MIVSGPNQSIEIKRALEQVTGAAAGSTGQLPGIPETVQAAPQTAEPDNRPEPDDDEAPF